MNITNFAKKVAEKPVFKTRIKSSEVKIPEMIIGYFLAPFCAMFANSIFGAYLNRYFRPVNRVLVNHASSKSELARENRRRIREIKKIQRRKKHYTEIDRDPKEKDENLTDRN